MKLYLFPMIVECMTEGGYYAECPVLQGCHVEGRTYTEAVENLEDAIKIFIKSYKKLKKKMPAVPTFTQNVVVTSGIPVLSEK